MAAIEKVQVRAAAEVLARFTDEDNRFETNPSAGAGSTTKFQVFWVYPTTDDEAEKRYACNLIQLQKFGVAFMSTKAGYAKMIQAMTKKGKSEAEISAACQLLADSYRAGGALTETDRVKVRQYTKMETFVAEGQTMEELLAEVQAFKAAQTKQGKGKK